MASGSRIRMAPMARMGDRAGRSEESRGHRPTISSGVLSLRLMPSKMIRPDSITVLLCLATLQLALVQSLLQAGLGPVPFAELADAGLEGRLRPRPLGELAEVHQELDRPIIALGH